MQIGHLNHKSHLNPKSHLSHLSNIKYLKALIRLAACAPWFMAVAFLLLPFSSAQAMDNDPIRIVFVSPRESENYFWGTMSRFMRVTAEQLNIELTIIDGGGEPYKEVKAAREALNAKIKPDYFIFAYSPGHGHRLLKLANDAKVKSINVNSLAPTEAGTPRVKFPFWIGQLAPNDKQAGYDLGTHLIQEAKAKQLYNDQNKIHIVALSGHNRQTVSLQREQGLIDAIAQFPSVTLRQIISTNWSQDDALYKTTVLLERYPETSVIWNASDELALSALKAAEKLSKVPGRDFIAGGIDGLSKGQKAVANGKLTATLTGHFMEGAWALILLHDYHLGHDFISEGTEFHSKFQLLTNANMGTYMPLLNEKKWHKINFKHFSKVYNPSIKKYDFSMENALKSTK
jgi:ABC-type sugar transport system substrate-binding protein